MSEQLTNAFGQQVPAPIKPWKPIAQMDAQERKQYNAERQVAHRLKKKKELELGEERTRLENDERNQAIREEQEFQRSIPTTPNNWGEEIAKQFEPVLNQMILELDRPGPWLYKRDYYIVRPLADLVFGIPRKYITVDNAGLRVAGGFPDAMMLAAIEYDKKILNRSKTFRDLYSDALRQTVSLIQDPKYKPFMEWAGSIRNAFEESISNIEFVR
jgi:hypothetical protein